MANLDPRIRKFIRLDGSNRTIPGSVVERKHKPKHGKWIEIPNDTCCDGVRLVSTPADVTDDTFTLTILCDGTPVVTQTVTGAVTTTIDDVVALLNAQAGYFGSFFVSGSDIILELSQAASSDICPDGTLTFTVTV